MPEGADDVSDVQGLDVPAPDAPVLDVHRVVVGDVVPLLRLAVARVLDQVGFTTVADTSLGREIGRLVSEQRAGFVVLGTPADLTPAETVRRLEKLPAPPRVLALVSRSMGDELVGARGSVTVARIPRVATADELMDAARRHAAGAFTTRGPSLEEPVPGDHVEAGSDAGLTAREREVLALLAEGRSNRQIASELYVSLPTVKTHVAHIYAKLDARNRNEALGRAVGRGLLR